MRISAKAEYACLAVLALAQQRPGVSRVRIRDISQAYNIPERYLVQILLQLKRAGIVMSIRGSGGGYRLARASEMISIREILTAIEGPDRTPADPAGAHAGVASALAAVWENARCAERAVLEGTTIAQLAAVVSPPEWTI
jgi:Rrf2 family transcriptional regulator, cysteine metabolism repressor